MYRDHTKVIKIGNRVIGGGNPILIQSMTNTKTEDVEATVAQILSLEKAGCDIIRCAVPTMEAAKALSQIKKQIHIPLVADIHFDYRLAIAAMENGADKIRINPGNIGSTERIKAVVDVAKERGIPIRVGVNSGSLEKELVEKYHGVTAEGLVESALDKVHIIEDLGYDNLVISIKSSDVLMCAKAHELIAEKTNYPLHVGITEAGTLYSGNIKSAIGLGIILNQGIGDTIRVSLTGAPLEEIKSAKRILKTLGLRKGGIEVVSCPTCGRTQIDLIGLANKVETMVQDIPLDIKVAVMGCVVNGPGEAKEADIGIAGGIKEGLLFKKGEIIRKVKQEDIVKVLKEEILKMVEEYCNTYHNQKKAFQEGDRIPYASRVYDSAEMVNLVDSSLEFWLTAGRYTAQFEKAFAEYLGVRYCSLVNSGSSANLNAFMALTSPLLGERQVKPGDEMITVAAGFPTTVTPAIQYGVVPVFVDVTIPQYNIDVTQLEAALSDKTKVVMAAHTLGNPFDLSAVKTFCDKHNLWLIEDNCDALGSKYVIDGEEKFTGTIGDIGTSSFYPPHHMTMGEGGAVYTNDPLLNKCIRSMRDWGRDCVCASGQDNLCGHRFDKQYGELPLGYDHKYVYSHFGYNLKATDMQAAVGCAQLAKFPTFVEKRRHNFDRLRAALEEVEDKLILPEPCPNSKPSWFGFLLTCREGVDKNKVVQYIEDHGVQTRMLFAGNIVKQPCFDEMRASGKGYRVVGDLAVTDRIMKDTFWLGVYPGMTDEKIDYMAKVIKEALQ